MPGYFASKFSVECSEHNECASIPIPEPQYLQYCDIVKTFSAMVVLKNNPKIFYWLDMDSIDAN